MNINYFNTADDLIDAFSIKNDKRYEQITSLGNRKVGFSVQIKYPEDIKYRPPKKKDGTYDTFALIHVVYAHPDETKTPFKNIEKIPLIITIVPYSRYRSNHFDYNFEDEDCPTEKSLEESKSSPKPVDLEYTNDFFYDHNQGSLLDKKGSKLSGSKLLESVMDNHCKTINTINALKLKFKFRSQSLVVNIINLKVDFFLWLIKNIFGRTLDRNTLTTAFLDGYKKENLKKLSTDSLKIFGYNAAPGVIILFCAIIAIFNLFEFKNEFFEKIISNNFLALIHTIIALYILDVGMPLLIFYIINLMIKIRKKVVLHKFQAP
jgi:hypothetical protein